MPTADDILNELTVPPVRWKKPVLLGICGLPATGKTTVAEHLASLYPMVVLSTDAIRLKHGFASGPETLEVICAVTDKLLARNRAVVIDGVYLDIAGRTKTQTLADKHEAFYRIIHTIATQALIDERLQARMDAPQATEKSGKFVITPEHFQRIKSYFQPPTRDEPALVVDTSDNEVANELEPLSERLYALHPPAN